jgi:hypothetical protein
MHIPVAIVAGLLAVASQADAGVFHTAIYRPGRGKFVEMSGEMIIPALPGRGSNGYYVWPGKLCSV